MNEYHDINLMRMQLIKNAQTKEELLKLLLYKYMHRAHTTDEEYAKIVCNKIFELLNINEIDLNQNL